MKEIKTSNSVYEKYSLKPSQKVFIILTAVKIMLYKRTSSHYFLLLSCSEFIFCLFIVDQWTNRIILTEVSEACSIRDLHVYRDKQTLIEIRQTQAVHIEIILQNIYKYFAYGHFATLGPYSCNLISKANTQNNRFINYVL